MGNILFLLDQMPSTPLTRCALDLVIKLTVNNTSEEGGEAKGWEEKGLDGMGNILFKRID